MVDQQNFNLGNIAATNVGVGNNHVFGAHGTATPPASASSNQGSAGTADGTLLIRMGFALDIVGYSMRSDPAQEEAQRRLLALLDDVYDALRVEPKSVLAQPAGDGFTVFLPPETQYPRAFPRLLDSLSSALAVGNRKYRDRIRVRLAVGIGPVAISAAGYTGSAVIELHRLLESQVLRDAVAAHRTADLVLLTSDTLYSYVVRAGYPGTAAGRFREVQVDNKEYRARAWLWRSR